MKTYKELLTKMSTAELVAEKKRLNVLIADHFRTWYDAVGTSFEMDEYLDNCSKRDAVVREAKIRLAEGRI